MAAPTPIASPSTSSALSTSSPKSLNIEGSESFMVRSGIWLARKFSSNVASTSTSPPPIYSLTQPLAPIDYIATDLLLTILYNLNVQEFSKVRCVCRRWSKCMVMAYLMNCTTAYFNFSKHKVFIPRLFPQRTRYALTTLGLELPLQETKLFSDKLSSSYEKLLNRILSCSPNVTTLLVVKCGARAIQFLIQNLPQIRHLTMIDCPVDKGLGDYLNLRQDLNISLVMTERLFFPYTAAIENISTLEVCRETAPLDATLTFRMQRSLPPPQRLILLDMPITIALLEQICHVRDVEFRNCFKNDDSLNVASMEHIFRVTSKVENIRIISDDRGDTLVSSIKELFAILNSPTLLTADLRRMKGLDVEKLKTFRESFSTKRVLLSSEALP